MTGSLASLIPTPLHPAVVHMPMALAVLLPLFAAGALIAVRRGARPMRAWGIAVAIFAALSASAFVSMETGGDQEDRVERVVSRSAIHSHEEAAEAFLWLSVGVLGVAALGLLPARAGSVARIGATVGSLLLLGAGFNVGHTGGALVYTYGAASAYVDTTAAGVRPAAATQADGGRATDGDGDR
jgi:uncharacterized membrane protein